jgi:putative transposase
MPLGYIHGDPVKHDLAQRPADWEFSSFHRYVKLRWYEPDWCGRIDLPGSAEYGWPA